MSGVSSNHIKGDKLPKKFTWANINDVYKGKSTLSQPRNPISKNGLQSLGKIEYTRRVPPPANLPSLKSENFGNDPNVNLVPSGGQGWGSRDVSALSVDGALSATAVVSLKSAEASVPNSAASRAAGSGATAPATATAGTAAAAAVTATRTVTGEKSWSSITAGTAAPAASAASRAPSSSSHFQHEFPQLSQSSNGAAATASGACSDMPSLRPNTEGSWAQGGRGRPGSEAGSSGTAVGVDDSAGRPVRAVGLGLAGQAQITRSNPALEAAAAHYRGVVPQFTARPGGAGELAGAAIPLAPRHSGPGGQGGPQSAAFRSRPPFNSQATPIVRSEDLHNLDQISSKNEQGWAGAEPGVDYNKKLAFSDDEEDGENCRREPQRRRCRSNELDEEDQLPARVARPPAARAADDVALLHVQSYPGGYGPAAVRGRGASLGYAGGAVDEENWRRRQQQEVSAAVERARQKRHVLEEGAVPPGHEAVRTKHQYQANLPPRFLRQQASAAAAGAQWVRPGPQRGHPRQPERCEYEREYWCDNRASHNLAPPASAKNVQKWAENTSSSRSTEGDEDRRPEQSSRDNGSAASYTDHYKYNYGTSWADEVECEVAASRPSPQKHADSSKHSRKESGSAPGSQEPSRAGRIRGPTPLSRQRVQAESAELPRDMQGMVSLKHPLAPTKSPAATKAADKSGDRSAAHGAGKHGPDDCASLNGPAADSGTSQKAAPPPKNVWLARKESSQQETGRGEQAEQTACAVEGSGQDRGGGRDRGSAHWSQYADDWEHRYLHGDQHARRWDGDDGPSYGRSRSGHEELLQHRSVSVRAADSTSDPPSDTARAVHDNRASPPDAGKSGLPADRRALAVSADRQDSANGRAGVAASRDRRERRDGPRHDRRDHAADARDRRGHAAETRDRRGQRDKPERRHLERRGDAVVAAESADAGDSATVDSTADALGDADRHERREHVRRREDGWYEGEDGRRTAARRDAPRRDRHSSAAAAGPPRMTRQRRGDKHEDDAAETGDDTELNKHKQRWPNHESYRGGSSNRSHRGREFRSQRQPPVPSGDAGSGAGSAVVETRRDARAGRRGGRTEVMAPRFHAARGPAVADASEVQRRAAAPLRRQQQTADASLRGIQPLMEARVQACSPAEDDMAYETASESSHQADETHPGAVTTSGGLKRAVSAGEKGTSSAGAEDQAGSTSADQQPSPGTEASVNSGEFHEVTRRKAAKERQKVTGQEDSTRQKKREERGVRRGGGNGAVPVAEPRPARAPRPVQERALRPGRPVQQQQQQRAAVSRRQQEPDTPAVPAAAAEAEVPVRPAPPPVNAWDKPITAVLRSAVAGAARQCPVSSAQASQFSSADPAAPFFSSSPSGMYDGAGVPSQTIVFENTNLRCSGGGVKLGAGGTFSLAAGSGPLPNSMAGVSSVALTGAASTQPPLTMSSEPASLSVERQRPLSSAAKAEPLELPHMFRTEEVRHMKLDFTFDSTELTAGMTDESLAAVAAGGTAPSSSATISAGNAELNMKIASVKRVWDTPSVSPQPGESVATAVSGADSCKENVQAAAWSSAAQLQFDVNKAEAAALSATNNVCKVKPQQQQQQRPAVEHAACCPCPQCLPGDEACSIAPTPAPAAEPGAYHLAPSAVSLSAGGPSPPSLLPVGVGYQSFQLEQPPTPRQPHQQSFSQYPYTVGGGAFGLMQTPPPPPPSVHSSVPPTAGVSGAADLAPFRHFPPTVSSPSAAAMLSLKPCGHPPPAPPPSAPKSAPPAAGSYQQNLQFIQYDPALLGSQLLQQRQPPAVTPPSNIFNNSQNTTFFQNGSLQQPSNQLASAYGLQQGSYAAGLGLGMQQLRLAAGLQAMPWNSAEASAVPAGSTARAATLLPVGRPSAATSIKSQTSLPPPLHALQPPLPSASSAPFRASQPPLPMAPARPPPPAPGARYHAPIQRPPPPAPLSLQQSHLSSDQQAKSRQAALESAQNFFRNSEQHALQNTGKVPPPAVPRSALDKAVGGVAVTSETPTDDCAAEPAGAPAPEAEAPPSPAPPPNVPTDAAPTDAVAASQLLGPTAVVD